MKRAFLLLMVIVSFLSCRTSKIRALQKGLNAIVDDEFYDNQFTGLLIYDPQTRDTLYKLNSEKYFTPASNTKIFTLYTALKTLPDSVPSLKYSITNETLFIEGTGDPTFLHPFFKDSTTLRLMSNYPKVAIHLNNFNDTPFASGWAWEDYDTYYSVERSGFPIYGNVIEISNDSKLHVRPSYLKNNVSINLTSQKRRAYNDNIFYYNRKRDTVQIPMVIDSVLIKNLFNDVLSNKITLISKMPPNKKQILYSIPSDSLYKRMMHESDNFLAEQMLIVSSSTLSDTLNSKKAREHMLEKHLKNMQHQPRWVDGSGLSRYNLFTPESFIYVLDKMRSEVSKERLHNLFPEIYPLIYAKSGSLGNNYNLSGYLITKSGKTLIFSFMNNHFKTRTIDVRRKLQSALKTIQETY